MKRQLSVNIAKRTQYGGTWLILVGWTALKNFYPCPIRFATQTRWQAASGALGSPVSNSRRFLPSADFSCLQLKAATREWWPWLPEWSPSMAPGWHVQNACTCTRTRGHTWCPRPKSGTQTSPEEGLPTWGKDCGKWVGSSLHFSQVYVKNRASFLSTLHIYYFAGWWGTGCSLTSSLLALSATWWQIPGLLQAPCPGAQHHDRGQAGRRAPALPQPELGSSTNWTRTKAKREWALTL